MAADRLVNYGVEERIGIVTINNPPANALSSTVLNELEEVIGEIERDDNVRVGIITGAGSTIFVAGADINEIKTLDSSVKGEDFSTKGQIVISRIEDMKKPIIAAINGHCLGGGNELAMACHIRIASELAKFGQPEINLGIIPGFGGTQRLLRIAGHAKAKELILTGDMITAKEALSIGLVNRIVPPADLLKQAKELARKIASKGKIAIEFAMDAIKTGMTSSQEDGLKQESRLFGKICETADMKEGIAAFIEKRNPDFQDK